MLNPSTSALSLLVWDIITAADVQHVVERAITLNVNASLLRASWLCCADAGRVTASAWGGVRIRCRDGARHGEGKECGNDEDELHVDFGVV
jgi:hypothetical protein